MRIEQFKVKNQFLVIDDSGTSFLKSYDSMVCRIDKAGNITLGKNWDYSKTTSKYVGWFIEEITGQKMNKGIIEKLIKQGNILVDETL